MAVDWAEGRPGAAWAQEPLEVAAACALGEAAARLLGRLSEGTLSALCPDRPGPPQLCCWAPVGISPGPGRPQAGAHRLLLTLELMPLLQAYCLLDVGKQILSLHS